MFKKLKRHLELEANIRQLERLSTRDLDDLGIPRGEIRNAVKGIYKVRA